MHVFVLVLVFIAVGRAESVSCCAVQVEYFVEDAFLLKSGEHPIKRYPVHGVAEELFQIRLRNGGFFFRDNLQHPEAGLRYLELVAAQ